MEKFVHVFTVYGKMSFLFKILAKSLLLAKEGDELLKYSLT